MLGRCALSAYNSQAAAPDWGLSARFSLEPVERFPLSPLLEVNGLTVEFPIREGTVHALTDVSFRMETGRVLALLGESDSGKTTIALSILGLIPYPGRMRAGTIQFEGRDLTTIGDGERRTMRGQAMSMVFQDAIAGLNPTLTVGRQIEEVLRAHTGIDRKEAKQRGMEIMGEIGIARPDHVYTLYPFEISGGMAQRVMIGMAMSLGRSCWWPTSRRRRWT